MNKTNIFRTFMLPAIDLKKSNFEYKEKRLDIIRNILQKVSVVGKKVGKVFRSQLIILTLLFTIRHFVPEIEEALPHVYLFLDGYLAPLIDYLYKLGLEILQKFFSHESITDIITQITSWHIY